MKISTNNNIYCIYLIKSDFDWLHALMIGGAAVAMNLSEYRSGPFKRRDSNKRRSHISAGGKDISKTITAGSQLSAGGRGVLEYFP